MSATRSSDRHIELMQLRPIGVDPFVLALESQHDDIIAPYMRANAIWEPAETLLLLRTLRPGMHVVDAGAHVGYYSVLLSRRVGDNGVVHAFEPEPDNYRLLSANVLLNDCRNVTAHRLALADSRGNEFLHLSGNNPGDHRLQTTPGRQQVAVAVTDLDSVLGDGELDFIKIDTQGAELRVLAGMQATLQRNRERLGCLMEFSPGLMALVGTSVAQFAARLTELDARVYSLVLNGPNLILRRVTPLDLGFQSLADALEVWNVVDAGCDVFLTFSDRAEQLWLTRFRGNGETTDAG